MKLHSTVIERLIKVYQNYGGYREENRLRSVLESLDLATYDRQTGAKNTVIVLTKDLEKKTI